MRAKNNPMKILIRLRYSTRYNGKVEVEYVHGKDPEVSFYSKRGGKVLQKSRIDHMTIQQILKFMKYKGFQKG